PADIVKEATGPNGASVTFAVSASDGVTQGLTPACAASSGQLFPIGTTTINCPVTDAAGNTGSASFKITVRDTTAPAVTVSPNQVLEATGPNGAAAMFSASASDIVGVTSGPSCSSASGATFAIGTTTVNCSASDAAGNTGSASLTITVRDTTAPVVTAPANQVLEATGPGGAAAMFQPSASDIVGVTSTTCSPASGSLFAIGTKSVTCSASDAAGNQASASFTVTVRDTTAPVVTVPGDLTRDAATSAGVAVTFAASSTDAVSGAPLASCLPASGSLFPIGQTVVTCKATDAAGNTGAAAFTVKVVDPVTPGEMRGDGFVRNGGTKYDFDFLVRERGTGADRGFFEVRVHDDERNSKDDKTKPRDDRFVANTITFAVFSDDPTIRPGHPRKPQIDTVTFSGPGDWDGKHGYRFEVFAQDAGEPGRHRESVRITIWDPAGTIVAHVEGDLDGGNVQSVRIHR
ncbi:MAG: HYR domain-containing protein, partial [Acidobacteriia bacterium]|nr:HYR domain-containing protein [Terriglobia bacterium]